MSHEPQERFSSFDYQLLLTFLAGMVVQILLPGNGIMRIFLATFWAGILVRLAIQHRQKHQWQWQGLTPLNVLRSIGTLTFGLWCLASVIVELADEPIYNRKWIVNDYLKVYSLEIFSEAFRILPSLLTSTSSSVSFILISFFWLIFCILVSLKVAYVSEEDFLKDCNQQNNFSHQSHRQILRFQSHKQILHLAQEKPRSLTKTITDFFTSRSFTLQKKPSFVRIEFYIVSSQDIQAIFESRDPQANIFTLISLTVMFLFSTYALIHIIAFELSSYLTNIQDRNEYPLSIVLLSIQILFFSMLSWLIWNFAIHPFFVKKVLEFKADKLVVGEKIFGLYRKLFSIHQTDLLPLKQYSKGARKPGVSNTVLLIQRRGKDIEIAGHLLPIAMEIVQETYDRYRTSTFDHFYDNTQPAYFE
ncbi:MAG: hypothetical protein SFY66_04860 [Oculatellaceae cyanobacterium bins.114]|nr:hypothetical protein [Oculatellaceae cyanobacterium bins.114]